MVPSEQEIRRPEDDTLHVTPSEQVIRLPDAEVRHVTLSASATEGIVDATGTATTIIVEKTNEIINRRISLSS